MHPVKPLLAAVLLSAFALTGAGQPVDVLPVRLAEGARSLNGTWKFKYVASSDIGADESFYQPGFDPTPWATLAVPGHWELAGFAEPQYADDLKEGTGLYRRTFRVPDAWNGQRVFLRFDGVLYGLTAWVNGKPVGAWASSYNPVTFDITDALRGGDAENVLAVRVTTRSKGWAFDTMDCWALSGIYRDVTLFALPAVHLHDYTVRTTLKPDGSAALQLEVVAPGAGSVAARLVAPDGKPAGGAELPVAADGHGGTTLTVAAPSLWTAETPTLYRLELDVAASGRVVQRFHDRIGLRQVTVEDGILKLNGTPIKLHGIDHHDLWPDGRVADEAAMRRDLELIRGANINFIRTSHYPPQPRLIELCDEMGIYVDDEVPFIHGRKNLTDPSYQDVLFTRARATVMRDKNRASVILWSVGNENPITELGLNTGRRVKELDPSRPITFPTMGSYFAENYQKFPEFADLYSPHYPGVKTARRYAETLHRPIVFTEYAHQRGLARSGTAVQDLWDVFYHSPRIAGGALWLFQDQGILRTAADRSSVKDGDLMVWLDDHRYYDTHGFYAMDGIVYSDRTPQIDYWQVRKVYSPVQIPERALTVRPGAQQLTVHVENRHDFRPLTGFTLHWALRRNGAALQDGNVALTAKPHATEAIAIPVDLPDALATDVFTLELRCTDDQGVALYERALRLDGGAAPGARWAAVTAALPATAPTLDVTPATITVQTSAGRVTVDRRSGQLSVSDAAGAPIVTAAGPHVGRHPTINDLGKGREREAALWRGNLLRDAADVKTDARTIADGVEITVSATYPRPGVPAEAVAGEYRVVVARTGVLTVSYRYAPVHATGEMLEAGFALSVPDSHASFRWLGEGPYAGYPGKDRLNEYGVFHLNRADLYFPGNRRAVELALLAAPAGRGLLLAGSAMTIDLEKVPGATILSHVALVPGEAGGGNSSGENVDISSRLKASAVKTISGSFSLLPLGGGWPAPLTRWFGQPGDTVKVTQPFAYSYDQ